MSPPFLLSLLDEAMEALHVVGSCNEAPLGFDVLEASGEEVGEAEGRFDDAEDRFDGLFSFAVFGFVVWFFEGLEHLLAPLCVDGPWEFWLPFWWGS